MKKVTLNIYDPYNDDNFSFYADREHMYKACYGKFEKGKLVSGCDFKSCRELIVNSLRDHLEHFKFPRNPALVIYKRTSSNPTKRTLNAFKNTMKAGIKFLNFVEDEFNIKKSVLYKAHHDRDRKCDLVYAIRLSPFWCKSPSLYSLMMLIIRLGCVASLRTADSYENLMKRVDELYDSGSSRVDVGRIWRLRPRWVVLLKHANNIFKRKKSAWLHKNYKNDLALNWDGIDTFCRLKSGDKVHSKRFEQALKDEGVL